MDRRADRRLKVLRQRQRTTTLLQSHLYRIRHRSARMATMGRLQKCKGSNQRLPPHEPTETRPKQRLCAKSSMGAVIDKDVYSKRSHASSEQQHQYLSQSAFRLFAFPPPTL